MTARPLSERAKANIAARKDELTKCEKRIKAYLVRLFAVAGREGRSYVWPSADTIADACGCSRSTVKRAKNKFKRLAIFAYRERYKVHGDRAWRLPDAIYLTAREAFLRPVPRVTATRRPTRRERVTVRLASELTRRLAASCAPLPAPEPPTRGRFIFTPASTTDFLKEERPSRVDRSRSAESLAGFAQRRAERLKSTG